MIFFSTSIRAQWTQKSAGLEGCPIDALHSDGNSIFAGTSVGVYRSMLTGNWSFMNGPSSPTSQFLNINCIAGTSDNLFAGTPYGALRSQDGGQSWSALRTGMQRSVQCMLFLNNKIYAGSYSGGIYQSENNGESWTPLNNSLPSSVGVNAIDHIGSMIYVATAEGVYYSSDEGASWQEIHPENNLRLNSTIAIKENMMFVGSGFSDLYTSVHDGITWSSWVKSNTGLPEKPSALVVHNESVYAGTNQGLYRYNSVGNDWSLLQNDDISSLPIFSLYSSEANLLAGTSDGVYVSTDNGSSWSVKKTGLSCTQVSGFVPFNDKLFAQTDNGLFVLPNSASTWSQVNKEQINSLAVLNNKLFASGRSGPLISADEGLTWMPGNSGLPPNPLIGTMMPHGNKLFAGVTHANLVYVSSDEGGSWIPASNGLPASPLVTGFASKGGNIYTAIGAHVYKSVDNGTTWISSSTGLPPDDRSSNIYFLKAHNSDLYAGFCCNKGLFKSSDDGLSWTSMNNGFPFDVDLFAMEATDEQLFVGGRVFQGPFGVYTIDINDDVWMPSNTGLPVFQNRALVIYDDILFGGFRGDISVWTQPVEDITTGIELHPKRMANSSCNDMGINTYPNPTGGYFHIDADDTAYGSKEIIITDVSGNLILRTERTSTVNTILDISNYATGMYIVKVSYAEKTCHTKLVKQQ